MTSDYYKIIEGKYSDRNEFEAEVSSVIEEGWVPVGGLVVTAEYNLFQALARFPPVPLPAQSRKALSKR